MVFRMNDLACMARESQLLDEIHRVKKRCLAALRLQSPSNSLIAANLSALQHTCRLYAFVSDVEQKFSLFICQLANAKVVLLV